MVNNLLYYQSNYFALFLSCLSLVTFLYPGSVLLGSVITVASVAAFHKFSTDKVSLRKNSRSFCYSILVWVWSTQEKASRSICGRTPCHCYILLVLIELESVWPIFFYFRKNSSFYEIVKNVKKRHYISVGGFIPDTARFGPLRFATSQCQEQSYKSFGENWRKENANGCVTLRVWPGRYQHYVTPELTYSVKFLM